MRALRDQAGAAGHGCRPGTLRGSCCDVAHNERCTNQYSLLLGRFATVDPAAPAFCTARWGELGQGLKQPAR